eukprot:s2194_g7.t1
MFCDPGCRERPTLLTGRNVQRLRRVICHRKKWLRADQIWSEDAEQASEQSFGRKRMMGNPFVLQQLSTMMKAMDEEDTEPMLRLPSGGRSSWKRWSLAVAATALVTLLLWQRSTSIGSRSESGSEDLQLYSAGYKEGVKYRLCNVDTKQCLTTSGANSPTLDFAPFNKADAFLIGGSRTAIVLSDPSKALCLQATSSHVTLQHCQSKAVFHVPDVHMIGTIRSHSGHCLRAVNENGSIKVQPGPCMGPGTSWLVGEVPQLYQSGTRYKICNTFLKDACVGPCKDEQACEGSELFLANKSKAAEFVIKNVRDTMEVTTLALAENPEMCVQTQGFGTCNGACALQSNSTIVFEKCQSTMQNFYLPFPPLSYGRLRWAMHDDRCVTALPPDKIQMFPCDQRAPILWQLVPS